MNGALKYSRKQVRRVDVRLESRRCNFYRKSQAQRPQAARFDGLLSAALVTLGLLGGLVAILPPSLLSRMPLLHISGAFFIPFATLFAFTNLRFITVIKVVLKGVVVSFAVCGLAVAASALQGAEQPQNAQTFKVSQTQVPRSHL
ncbi:MAG: hypothetical protein ACK5GN_15485 [Pseudomonadota bacterium]|jgi:hypothetical protein